MASINRYSPPETRDSEDFPTKGKSPWWLCHLLIVAFLFPAWFMIGGAISISGRPIDVAIDGLGFLLLFGYAGICLLVGVIDLFRR